MYKPRPSNHTPAHPTPDIQMYILYICTTLSLPRVLGFDEDGQETERQKNNLFRLTDVLHGW